MAYANPTVVYARDRGFTFTATSKPSTGDVEQFLEDTAVELDGILRGRGYQLPIPTTATTALQLLANYNAHGALAMIELSAPTSGDKRDDAQKLWNQCKRMLASGDVTLDVALSTDAGLPRHGGQATAMFNRDMGL